MRLPPASQAKNLLRLGSKMMFGRMRGEEMDEMQHHVPQMKPSHDDITPLSFSFLFFLVPSHILTEEETCGTS